MNYVLGGGLAGLIWAYYHKDWTILAGHELASASEIPIPRYIYWTEKTCQLHRELFKKEPEMETINVGIRSKAQWWSRATNDMKKNYHEKTRGKRPIHVSQHVMSSGETHFDIIDTPYNLWENALIGELDERIIKEDVVTIDIEHNEIHTDNSKRSTIAYDKMVNTLPLPLFFTLTNDNDIVNAFSYSSVVLTLIKCQASIIWENDYDYILFPDLRVPFFRMTKGEKPYLGIESKESLSKDSGKFWLEGMIVEKIEEKIMKYGKIISGPSEFQNLPSNIKLFGRFGTWDPRIKIHHLIEEVQSNVPESIQGV
jgi:hypothetical protein